MKAKIEKRLIRAKKEVSLLNQRLRKIDAQMKDLQNSAQQIINSRVAKEGAVTELEEILASLFKQDQELKKADQPGTVKEQIGKGETA